MLAESDEGWPTRNPVEPTPRLREIPRLATFTGRLAVAVCPFMVTLAVRVLVPSGTALVSHECHSVVPVTLSLVITAPSMESVMVLACPHTAVVDSPTVWLPFTTAPVVG